MNVTIGNLIDALQTCNMKIWSLEDRKRLIDASDSDIAEATKKTNVLNVQRNVLIENIDLAMNEIAQGRQQQLFGQGGTKMYGK